MAYVHSFRYWRHPLKYPINTCKCTHNAKFHAQAHMTCKPSNQVKNEKETFHQRSASAAMSVFCLWRTQHTHNTHTYTHQLTHTSSHPVLAGAREQLGLGWRACLLLLIV